MIDEAVLERLRAVPQATFAKEVLKIAGKRARDGLIPLDCTGRLGQIRLQEAIDHQEGQDLPVRIIIVKSRQTGCSTWIQGYMTKRAVTMPLRNILIVAHKMDTARNLFVMGRRMYDNLPASIKPGLVGRATPTKAGGILHFGTKAGGSISGLDSRIQIDTAEEVGGGRGFTYTDLHLSEPAWWPSGGKALSLLPAVPDEPGTSIFFESTANGLNWFHKRYKAAVDGKSEYIPVFIGWHEDPSCVRPFASEEARAAFIETIGDPNESEYAEEEPYLVEEFGCTPEQLHFRRTAIVDKCEGKIEFFKQEFPATWTEAFIGSGKQVFSVIFTQRAVREAEHWDEKPPSQGGPQRGIFMGENPVERHLSDGTVRVPSTVRWVPKAEIPARAEWWPGQFYEEHDPLWTLWLPEGFWPGREWTPEEWRQRHAAGELDIETMDAGMARASLGPGQFIVTCDPADDIENNSPAERDEHAFNAIVAIDHRTGAQTAEWEARADHDLVARQMFLAGTFFNEAWMSAERTGGYGNVLLDLLQRRFYYRLLYSERALSDKKLQEKRRYGWVTSRETKPQMEGTTQALLREETHGIRSPRLAGQLVTYVKVESSTGRMVRHEPSPGNFSDLLMAWMQAQEIRRVTPLRPPPSSGPPPNSIPPSYRGRFR